MGLYNVINRALMQSGQTEDISQVVANLDAIATILNGQIDPQNMRGAPNLQIQETMTWTGSAYDRSTSTKLTPASMGTGTPDATKYWRGDGAWTVFPTVNYATTLPGSPTDSQETILVDSLTVPTYAWRMRYNAALTKWEFVGGRPLRKNVNPNVALNTLTQVGATGTYRNVGTDFVVPYAGSWFIQSHFVVDPNGTAGWGYVDTFVGAGMSGDSARGEMTLTPGTAGQTMSFITFGHISGATASQTIGASMATTVPGTHKLTRQTVFYWPDVIG